MEFDDDFKVNSLTFIKWPARFNSPRGRFSQQKNIENQSKYLRSKY